MQSRVRSLINRLCDTLTEQFGFSFGLPVTQDFNDVADEGDSTEFANANHRHGMPALPDDTLDSLDSHALEFNEMTYTTTGLDNRIETTGTVALTNRDVPTEKGGFGTVDVTSSTAANTGSSLYITQGGAGTTTKQNTYFPRIRRFECRAMPHTLTAGLTSLFSAIGGFRTSTASRFDTLTDGVYFFLNTSVSANWFAVVRTGSVDLYSHDTGLAPRDDGSGNTLFDTFRIDYDGTDITFLIGRDENADGVVEFTQVGSTSVTPPGLSNLLAGWGGGTSHSDSGAGTARTFVVDNILVDGLRTAQ